LSVSQMYRFSAVPFKSLLFCMSRIGQFGGSSLLLPCCKRQFSPLPNWRITIVLAFRVLPSRVNKPFSTGGGPLRPSARGACLFTWYVLTFSTGRAFCEAEPCFRPDDGLLISLWFVKTVFGLPLFFLFPLPRALRFLAHRVTASFFCFGFPIFSARTMMVPGWMQGLGSLRRSYFLPTLPGTIHAPTLAHETSLVRFAFFFFCVDISVAPGLAPPGDSFFFFLHTG